VAEELNPQKARVLLMLGLAHNLPAAALQERFGIY
jgi:L-asparaginase/Glu-tRNA(Gln) amidotransferase subunit D